jgi:apocytochrome f
MGTRIEISIKPIVRIVFLARLVLEKSVNAYPIFAQQNYKNPREANGRIVCANCHLAQKPVEIEAPQAVFPNHVFEVITRVPYDQQVKQVLSNGKFGRLNVGAIIVLPDGFHLAPPDKITRRLKEHVGKYYFQPYRRDQENILVIGPIPGKGVGDIVFPVVAPDPNHDKNVSYLKYPLYLGGNRGRGQVYPDGTKSNNTVYTASTTGKIKEVVPGKKGGYRLTLENRLGNTSIENVPPGASLLVKVGQNVRRDDPLTTNPNVGGFGQAETEIVLQNPSRIRGLLCFFVTVVLTQVLLVLKKKQFEKVQLVEISF